MSCRKKGEREEMKGNGGGGLGGREGRMQTGEKEIQKMRETGMEGGMKGGNRRMRGGREGIQKIK